MRIWSNRGEDSGSVHCLGNGQLCAYEQGLDIVQIFGPPYSSPSFLRLSVTAGGCVEARSTREPGSAIWHHELTTNAVKTAEFLDFIEPDSPCMVRRMSCTAQTTLTLTLGGGIAALPNPSRFRGAAVALLVWAPAGTSIYGAYPTTVRQYMQVLFTGDVTCRESGENSYEIMLPRGQSEAYFCGGPGYPEAMAAAERILETDSADLLLDTRRHWQAFTGRRRDFAALIPAGFPQKGRLLELIDSVSVLIKAQQDCGGGVLAGYNYHLGYVRDQYGVSRCLLALGYTGEARAILNFYWTKWKIHGIVRNAQGMGADVFHIHENDDVEITGYLIIQAFDYLKESGDEAFVAEITPMLQWAFDVQRKHLVRFMLPFNGDETYIAGGILPRDCILHGSAEATLLFITGGRRLMAWIEKQGIGSPDALAEGKRIIDETEAQYAANFVASGQLITNNPARTAGLQPPAFRHGVCQQCNAFGWTERSAAGFYLCPQCWECPQDRVAQDKVRSLKSVSLMPRYIGSSTLAADRLKATVEEIMAEYAATGRLPSSPDADSTVGYDYGLLLFNLVQFGLNGAQEIAEKMLGIADDTDAWVEYYVGGRPHNTRCRPWESGINLHAAIEYALGWQ